MLLRRDALLSSSPTSLSLNLRKRSGLLQTSTILLHSKYMNPLEQAMPDIGLVKVSDSETGEEKWIDTSSLLYKKSL